MQRSTSSVTAILHKLKGAALLAGIPTAFAVAGLLAGLAYGTFKTPAYTATSYVLVVSQPEDGPPAAVSFAQAYGRLAALPETLAWAAEPLPAADLAQARERIQASTSPDTPLVRLTASAGTPEDAARYANTAADALVRYGNSHQHDTGVRVALMTKAAVPLAPSSPNPPLNVAVGTATGILLGGLAAAAGTARGRRRLQRVSGARGPARPRLPKAAARPKPAAQDTANAGQTTGQETGRNTGQNTGNAAGESASRDEAPVGAEAAQ